MPGTRVRLKFPPPAVGTELRGTVVSSEGSVQRLHFEELTIAEQEVLTMVLYSRADSWLGWGEGRESDDVLQSLGRIFQISMHGLAMTFRTLFKGREKSTGRSGDALSVTRSLVILALATGLAIAPVTARGQVVAAGAGPQKTALQTAQVRTALIHPNDEDLSLGTPVTPQTGQYRDTFTLNEAGSPQIELHGIDSRHDIFFTLPQTHVPRSAKMHVYYAFSPSLLPQLSHIKLMMNGTLFATIQPTPGQGSGSDSKEMDAEFDIPAELLVHDNDLTIQFIGHYTLVCEDAANTTLWARVHRNTTLDIQGDLLPIADDVKQLPMPFLDPAVVQPLNIPIVFPSMPTMKAIQAAGVVASYFCLLYTSRCV